jgi:hypothetical protein
VRLSDREWTTWRLIAALGIAQILIHVALQVRLFAPPAMAPMAHMPGMNMSPVGPFSPQSTMFFSHVTAVVVTALVLRRGEEFVLAIRARLATALFFGFREVRLPALGQLVVRAVARPESLRHLPALAGAVTRRGPPLMCAAPLFS